MKTETQSPKADLIDSFIGWDSFMKAHGVHHCEPLKIFAAYLIGYGTGNKRRADTVIKIAGDYTAYCIRQTCTACNIPLWPAIVS